MSAHNADTVACPTCHGEPCDKCGGSGKQIEEAPISGAEDA